MNTVHILCGVGIFAAAIAAGATVHPSQGAGLGDVVAARGVPEGLLRRGGWREGLLAQLVEPGQTPSIQVIDGGRYWELKAHGSVLQEERTGDTLEGVAWTPHGQMAFRVPWKVLEDRGAKEIAYISVVRASIEDGIMVPGVGKDSLMILQDRLHRLVRVRLAKPGDWIEWWKTNQGNLHLSRDGEYLEVESAPKAR